MVSIPTFLLILACAASGIALRAALRAEKTASNVPGIPDKLRSDYIELRGAVVNMADRLDKHIKSDAGYKGNAVKRSRGGNGEIQRGDYGALETLVHNMNERMS